MVVALTIRPLAGIPLRVAALQTAAQWVCEVSAETCGRAVDVHLVNAYTVALSHRDPMYKQILSNACANFPDGKPLQWVSRFSLMPLRQVRGPDLFEKVMDVGREYGLRHYLLGTTTETLRMLIIELERRYPGVLIVGSQSPPFRELTDGEQAQQDNEIRLSGAQITWVGLGTPKQDIEAQRISRALPGVAVAVGAAFDFVAGVRPEAPRWMSSIGLEWAFRLASEPRRLWRRYLIGNFVFVWAVLRRGGRT